MGIVGLDGFQNFFSDPRGGSVRFDCRRTEDEILVYRFTIDVTNLLGGSLHSNGAAVACAARRGERLVAEDRARTGNRTVLFGYVFIYGKIDGKCCSYLRRPVV